MFLKMMNGFIQIERWTSPFTIFSVVKVNSSGDNLWLIP
jgi:hypothetical protein